MILTDMRTSERPHALRPAQRDRPPVDTRKPLPTPPAIPPRPQPPRSAPDPEPRPEPTGLRWSHLFSALLSVLAVASWVWSVQRASLDDLTDLGLAAALPPGAWAAAALSVLAFVVALRARPFSTPFTALAVLGLMMVVYATPAAIEGTPRMEASYRHLGIIEQISVTGAVDRSVDAYFSWPGFFALSAFLQDVAGADSLLAAATVAPFVAAVAYLLPLLLIMRSLTSSLRLQWLGVGLFYVVNWTGQDYLAPQTFAFWLFLCILGVLLALVPPGTGAAARGWLARLRRWLRLDSSVDEITRRVPVSRAQHRGLLVGVVVVSFAIVASHQLTPYLLAVILGMLWIAGRTRAWWLPVVVGGLALFWLFVPAWPFTSGHLLATFAGTGGDGQGRETVGQRMANGSEEHLVVITARVAESVGVWALAVVGAVLLWRRGRRGVAAPLVLMAGAFVFVPLQTYGGEMMIRAYLFSLPFAAALAAVALARLDAGWAARLRGVLLFVVISGLVATTMVTRYGNERGESFREAELIAHQWVYSRQDPDTTVLALTDNTPWRFERYSSLEHTWVASAEPGQPWPRDPRVSDVVAQLEGTPGDPVYVVYTRSQAAMAELSGNTAPGTVQELVDDLSRDPRFVVKYDDEHATVLRWAG